MTSWAEVEEQLASRPLGTILTIPRTAIEAPSVAGATVAVGLPRGELRGWRFPPTVTCRGLHVHEFAEHYEAHLDAVHPACDLLAHARADAPELLVLGLVGAALGLLAAGGRRSGRGLVGAGLGALTGVLVAAHLKPRSGGSQGESKKL